VTFDSYAGLTYDIYVSSSDMDAPNWSVAGSVAAVGPSTTWNDPAVGGAEKYYKVGVQGTSPVVYSPNEGGVAVAAVLGFTAPEVEQLGLMGISMACTTGTTIQDVIGWHMTGGFDATGADEIWVWNPATDQYSLQFQVDTAGSFPTFDGQWWDNATFMPSTAAMTPGVGFWARSQQTFSQNLAVDGLVMRSATSIPVYVDGVAEKLHQMANPYANNMALDQNTSFWGDGALGAFDASGADEIWFWQQASDQYQLAFLVDTAGSFPTFDGQWWDNATFMPTGIVMTKGYGFWFRSQPDGARAGSPSWNWAEPVPY
jgi:hypothetical protein